MKVKTISSVLMSRDGRRMDSGPYMSGSQETKLFLERLPVHKAALKMLTYGHDGGVYNGPKFARNWVASPEYGVPFLNSSDMLQADLTQLPLLRKSDAYSPRLAFLRLSPGMILISCTGTIGRMIYTRPDMDGIWSSQHIMKVVPNPQYVLPGYLYAFLSSKFGVPMVVSGTYGSIIQSIEPHHIADLPVPRLSDAVEQRAHALVEEAAQLRSEAALTLRKQRKELSEILGLPQLTALNVSDYGVTTVNSGSLRLRLDAPYHAKAAIEVDSALRMGSYQVLPLTDVLKSYFKPPIFKRIWVDYPEYGRLFVSGNTAYHLAPEEPRYVSHRTPNFDAFIVKRGWLIFQAAGQIYGIFGQPLFVIGWLENAFCADDLYRLVPYTEVDGAYLYLFFGTDYGQILIKRQACGNSIPRVWDPHIMQLEVPWPDEETRAELGSLVIKAQEKMEIARLKQNVAISLVEQAIEGAA
jgi:type I restriction enzyme, S subunit